MDERLKTLERYNNWENGPTPVGYVRTACLDALWPAMGNNLIKVLSGQRRTGKSFLLRQLAGRLLSNGVPAENILFINKEFAGFGFLQNQHDLLDAIDLYCQYKNPQGRFYLLLDEVQDITGWELVVNSLAQDFTQNCELVITGSNSTLLSGELATKLSGRYVEFKVYPFSFAEFCGSRNLPMDKNAYLQYLQTGGLPELLNLPGGDLCRNYLDGVRDSLLLKDVVRRYTVKDIALLERLFSYFVCNAGNLQSINKIANTMKSAGSKASYDTIAQYARYLEEAFVIHRVDRYNIHGKELLKGMAKYYINDQAFYNYLYSGIGFGAGYLLENVVYMELLKAGFTVYTGAMDGGEVDFVAIKKDRKIYIQVAFTLAEQSIMDREYAPLGQIADNYEKVVISLDDLPLPNYEGIRHIQAWNLAKLLQNI